MNTFSTHWKSSTKARKQRKYRYNAPLHLRSAFMHAHLTKELRAKYGFRSLQIRKGDKVKIMRGAFKKSEGKVEDVNLKLNTVFVEKIERIKRDGSVIKVPLDASNLLLIELVTDDKKRFSKQTKVAPAQKVAPEAPAPKKKAAAKA